MSIISYAQNFEDVILWRALGHIPNGFYIDVGAQHPSIESVSKAFYERGWRGMHVEATSIYASLIREDRPDELVLQLALSDKNGSMTFYEIPDTGLSTGDKSIAENHRSQGYNVVETVVPCITLAEAFAQVGPRDVHWLKIDVEGMEGKVLAGWGDCPVRPWIIVVEGTYPNSQVKNHQTWESLVLDRGYVNSYFDGVSQYYVLSDRHDLIKKLGDPPNIFDNFSLALTVPINGNARNLLQEQQKTHDEKIVEERNSANESIKTISETLALRENELSESISKLEYERLEFRTKLQTETGLIKQEVENLLRAKLEREQAMMDKIEIVRTQAIKESTELAFHFVEQQRNVLDRLMAAQEQAVKEKSTLSRIHAENLSDLHKQHKQREVEFSQQLYELQQEIRVQQGDRLTREQEILAQFLTHQEKFAQEKVDLLLKQTAYEQELRLKHSEREALLIHELESLQKTFHHKEEDWKDVEQKLHFHIGALKQEAKTLHDNHQEKYQHYNVEIIKQRNAHAQELEAWNALKNELSIEIKAREQNNLTLRQSLIEVQRSLATTHASIFWRVTAPFRIFAKSSFSENEFSPKVPEICSIAKTGMPLAGTTLSDPLQVPFDENVTSPTASAPITSVPVPNIKLDEPSLATPSCIAESPLNNANNSSTEAIMPSNHTTTSSIDSSAVTLDELLAYHDRNFIEIAYQTVLGRMPDSEGLAYYLHRLRSGYSKVQILMQLRSSEEGVVQCKHIPQLEEYIQLYKNSRIPLIGWLFKRIYKIEGNNPVERKLRIIENQIGGLSDDSNRRLSILEKSLDSLSYVILQKHISAGDDSMNISFAENNFASDDLKRLSSRARDIYFQLKTAVKMNVKETS